MPLYRVTEAAPPRVAGRRVKAGAVLDLPAFATQYERELGYLEPVEAEDAPAPEDAPTPEGGAAAPAGDA